MISERIDTKPVEELLNKHRAHVEPYEVEFQGLNLVINPEVFDPTLTKVSGFLASNIEIEKGEKVLEMFCGSGAIALLCAQRGKYVVGVDVSAPAIECATQNSERLGIRNIEFRNGALWQAIQSSETFDVIVANPPLLPAIPETLLERAVADSPTMEATTSFIRGCASHLNKSGRVYMAFSNACKAYYNDPLAYMNSVASESGMDMSIKAEWDVGYEIYRVLKFTKSGYVGLLRV